MSNWDKIALGVRPVNKLASRVAKKEDLGLDNTSEYIKKLERENLLLKQEVELLKAECNYAHDQTLKAAFLMKDLIDEQINA